VLIPAHTYMATATSVLAAGAIPVIVDIDETLTIDPEALEAAIGPRTRAVVPVHMWGTACAMERIMVIAARHKLIVIEDACQGVGGSYEGRKFGTIGDAGCFSFNYYKNMTAGEGGGVAVNDDTLAERASHRLHFYGTAAAICSSRSLEWRARSERWGCSTCSSTASTALSMRCGRSAGRSSPAPLRSTISASGWHP
jgi:dTDP-4-amino-4,6-dideoxygalactose transaminase